MKKIIIHQSNTQRPTSTTVCTFKELLTAWNSRTISSRSLITGVTISVEGRASGYSLEFTDVTAVDKFLKNVSTMIYGGFYTLIRTDKGIVRNSYVSRDFNSIKEEYKHWKSIANSESEYQLFSEASIIAANIKELEQYLHCSSTLPEPLDLKELTGEYDYNAHDVMDKIVELASDSANAETIKMIVGLYKNGSIQR